MRLFTNVLLFILISTAVYGQYTIQDWYGTWSGDLHILRSQDTMMQLPMSLEIGPTDVDSVHNWIISYAVPDKPVDRRPYVLISKNEENGQFILDEKNGIRMQMNMHGNAIYSLFDVMQTRLFSRAELNGDKLIYGIETASLKDELVNPADSISGNPTVYAWPVNGRHRAILTKEK